MTCQNAITADTEVVVPAISRRTAHRKLDAIISSCETVDMSACESMIDPISSYIYDIAALTGKICEDGVRHASWAENLENVGPNDLRRKRGLSGMLRGKPAPLSKFRSDLEIIGFEEDEIGTDRASNISIVEHGGKHIGAEVKRVSDMASDLKDIGKSLLKSVSDVKIAMPGNSPATADKAQKAEEMAREIISKASSLMTRCMSLADIPARTQRISGRGRSLEFSAGSWIGTLKECVRDLEDGGDRIKNATRIRFATQDHRQRMADLSILLKAEAEEMKRIALDFRAATSA